MNAPIILFYSFETEGQQTNAKIIEDSKRFEP